MLLKSDKGVEFNVSDGKFYSSIKDFFLEIDFVQLLVITVNDLSCW